MTPTGRRGRALVLGIGLAIALPAVAAAQPQADAVRFAADVERARGHLLVSEQLYMLGQAGAAALHAAHPVQELGNRLIGPVRRVDAARADRLREALKEPGRAIEAKESPSRYVAMVVSVGKTLDEAVTLVVGQKRRASVGFRARVIAALLGSVAEEYEEAFKDGRITQLVEYQDAYGFFRRARTLYEALPRDFRRVDVDIALLSNALPSSREPPSSPTPPKTVRELTERIRTFLRGKQKKEQVADHRDEDAAGPRARAAMLSSPVWNATTPRSA